MSTPPPYRNFVNRQCVLDFQQGKVVTLSLTQTVNLLLKFIDSMKFINEFTIL